MAKSLDLEPRGHYGLSMGTEIQIQVGMVVSIRGESWEVVSLEADQTGRTYDRVEFRNVDRRWVDDGTPKGHFEERPGGRTMYAGSPIVVQAIQAGHWKVEQ